MRDDLDTSWLKNCIARYSKEKELPKLPTEDTAGERSKPTTTAYIEKPRENQGKPDKTSEKPSISLESSNKN